MFQIAKLLLLYIVFVAMIIGVYQLDRYLKTRACFFIARANGGEYPPDHTHLEDGTYDNNFVLIPLGVVNTIIFTWCFYLRFSEEVAKRQKILWVEVQDSTKNEFNISRMRAKENLMHVCLATKKLKEFSTYFDKYWYQRREHQYIGGMIREFRH